VFLESPILGVGWGQQSYESKEKYPDWALKNNYEFNYTYLNENVKSFPPGYNLYLRILTETGIFGFVIFMVFLLIFIKIVFIELKGANKKYKFIPLTILISGIGYLLNWLQIDTFRIYGFWLCLAILIILKEKLKTDE